MPTHPGSVVCEGLLKIKLAHAQGFSVLLPDILLVEESGWKWFAPKYFTPPLLSFRDNEGYCQFVVETLSGAELFVAFTKDRLVRKFGDGSALYRCRISALPGLSQHATGACQVDANSTPILPLYHHTTKEVVEVIKRSGHFIGSRWNIQGSKKLLNVDYVYFTTLPSIQSDQDLVEIAMASDGLVHFLPTNGTPPKDVVSINVYRESTLNRNSTISMHVRADLLSPQHIWSHSPRGGAAYYEISRPAIFRVGIMPGARLPFADETLRPIGTELRKFGYVVLGDADTPSGLVAPFDEENTKAILRIEHLSDSNLFDHWRENANTDQFAGQHVERQEFEPL